MPDMLLQLTFSHFNLCGILVTLNHIPQALLFHYLFTLLYWLTINATFSSFRNRTHSTGQYTGSVDDQRKQETKKVRLENAKFVFFSQISFLVAFSIDNQNGRFVSMLNQFDQPLPPAQNRVCLTDQCRGLVIPELVRIKQPRIRK